MCIYKTDDGKCKKFSTDTVTSYCVESPCEHEKLSNYDRIRNMSVEEMAELICESNCQKFCTFTKNGKCNVFEGGRQTCIMGIKQYLESEVDTE